jgi:hypothetical protein
VPSVIMLCDIFVMLSVVLLNATRVSLTKCSIVILIVIIPSVTKLNVILLSVAFLSCWL